MEADKYFTYEGKYEFDVTKLKDAHDWCQNAVRVFMENKNKRVVVSNTFTQEWEMKPYFEMAEHHGYKIFSIVIENFVPFNILKLPAWGHQITKQQTCCAESQIFRLLLYKLSNLVRIFVGIL